MKKSGCSCGAIAAAVVVLYVIAQIFSNWSSNSGLSFLLILALVFSVAVAILVSQAGSKRASTAHANEFQQTVSTLQTWIDSDSKKLAADIAAKGEQNLFELPNIQLMEYKSNGTEFVAGHAGVSFPIVGRVRGYTGGTRGESVRKPEVLTQIDAGKVLISNERIIFVGEKETDEWSWDKLVDAQAGDNGLWIKLASSKRAKNAFLQHEKHDQLPIAMAIGIANEWFKGGQGPAVEYAKGIVSQINSVANADTRRGSSKR